MKNQALFSLKDTIKKLKCCLLQFLFDALRVNILQSQYHYASQYYLVHEKSSMSASCLANTL